MAPNTQLFTYTLHLADTALIAAQRNSEWCGHGPVLEQDIAISNISLDLLGQARNFYQLAATLYNGFNGEEQHQVDWLIPRPWKSFHRELNEDDLAFLREERQFLNLLLCELPKGDWAVTILRQFLLSAFQVLQYRQLLQSREPQLASIAEKAVKEVQYHLRWSSEWVIRLGEGTEESARRINRALEELWPFTGELLQGADYELQVAQQGVGVDPFTLKEEWFHKVASIFDEATLALPKEGWMQQGGKKGMHTEHLGYILAEMQYLQRTFPNVVW